MNENELKMVRALQKDRAEATARAEVMTARAMAAEKRVATLQEAIEKMINGEIPLSTSIKAHFLAALEANSVEKSL
jgi:hypothetical protein